MKDRPILMSAPMVVATLRDIDPKTQTRRICKLKPVEKDGFASYGPVAMAASVLPRCPYGQSGDRLWVREAWQARADMNAMKPSALPPSTKINYLATDAPWVSKKRPSMFMPRWACRIQLEIVSVRVERLLDISEADAIAEGIERLPSGEWKDYGDPTDSCADPISSYRTLWESINGFQSSKDNPWVWVVEFKRLPQ